MNPKQPQNPQQDPQQNSQSSNQNPQSSNPKPAEKDPALQGEGNYTAARRYDSAQQDFIKSGKVHEAAEAAAPRDAKEAQEMKDAEQTGRSKAKR